MFALPVTLEKEGIVKKVINQGEKETKKDRMQHLSLVFILAG